jgi:hypothetical protein
VTGPATNKRYWAVCYLHAYWLMRYYRLDEHPLATKYHRAVLGRTPEFRID